MAFLAKSQKTADLPHLIALVGPTASGKTEWSLQLAKKFNGEIISADSRQIYKKMSIGTAKVAGEWKRIGLRRTYVVDGVSHHLVDFLNPGKTFSVAEFRDQAIKYAKMIGQERRVPLLVGGTGLYISSVIDNLRIPRVPANKKLRKSLEEKSLSELMQLLQQLDPEMVLTIDKGNKRRIIRALEVCIFTGEPFSHQRQKGEPLFRTLQIGIDIPREVLYDRIEKRVDLMMEQGLLHEVELLIKQRYGWELPSMNGIGYRQFRPYFEGTMPLEKVVAKFKQENKQFARRQLTWFRRDTRIHWCREYDEVEKLVTEFLQQ